MSVALDHGITSLDPVMLPTVDSTSRSFPLGSTVRDGGVTFRIFSRAASCVLLLRKYLLGAVRLRLATSR
jgi:hypothetical protein